MMDLEAHWNRIAPSYNDEIFDVFNSDRKKILRKYFKRHGSKAHTAIDFGCGNGKAFPFLSPLFKKIIAVDISNELLEQARLRHYKNVLFKQADLTIENLKLPRAEFAFCCNVMMFADVEKNYRLMANLHRALKPGGTGLVVIPSLDSALFSSWRLINLYRMEGVKPEKISPQEFHYFKGDKRSLIQGIVHIDNVPTKHYTESEIQVIFDEMNLPVTALEKIEYDWDTELASPPSWLKAPYPWDWLVECRKK
jgi:SAM-dependent methyltransferase